MSDELRALARSLGDAAGRMLAVQQENERLTAIVRDLAAEDDRPPLDRDGDCHFCLDHYDGSVESHAESCPWRRAVEWLRDTGDTT